MTHLTRRAFSSAALAAAAAGTLPKGAFAQAAEKVTLQIDGAAVPFYAPIYLAMEKGYFAKNGLDVQVVYAAASDIMRNVAAGNVELGFPNGDSVIAAKASGLPVKVVHTTYQRGIGATLFKADKGIKTFADLKGKKVAVTAIGSPNYLQLQVGLKKAGLTVDDVKVEVIATGAIVQALQADQVDAIVFSELRKYNLEGEGVKVGMISSNDFLPSFGNVVVTGEKFLQQKPKLVKGFNAGLDEALNFVIKGGIDEALSIAIAKHAPTWKGQEALLKRAFEETFVASVWQSPLTKEKGLGAGDLAGWQKNVDILAEYKVIDRGFKAEDLVVQPADIKA
ncbi:ABC transporter substrate-binding protein [uncultured Alsobacter sp.]|uniref:ABC transporter substrate-binding protein n=1 Tax=uncultured Alsobacter sp. TaxID=1748258 RepID=UPI0025ECFCA3|nr:ABC transporter substrate-binding protein [uncultured Alsobacter sp.]